jgi:hypothetical protein
VLYLGEAQAGALGLEAAATGWRAEVAGVGGPTYRAATPSACGPRRGWRGVPGGGAARPLRSRGNEGADTRGHAARERREEESGRSGGRKAPTSGARLTEGERERGGSARAGLR